MRPDPIALLVLLVGVAGWCPPPTAPMSMRPQLRRQGTQLQARKRGFFRRIFGWRRREKKSEAPFELPLTLSEELQLMTLGLSREEARSLPVSEARDRLEKAAKKAASVPLKSRFESMLDSDDLELFETAKKEVAAMKQFAQKELDGVPLPPPLSEAELNASLARTWPDLVTFTNLLTKEALFRLRILGPAFAEPLKEESRLRRNIYRAWLDFVDGVGLFPEFNIFEPTGGPPVEQGGADVERVYEDLKRRRDDLALTTKQFEEWERKAAKRNLVALPPSSEDEGGEQQKKALSR